MAYLIFPKNEADRQALLAFLGTNNKGELMTPARDIRAVALVKANGETWSVDEAEEKWRFLLVHNGSCFDVCQDLMYTARQVHVRLGEKALRVERVIIGTSPIFTSRYAALLEQEYPHVEQWFTSSAISNVLADTGLPELERLMQEPHLSSLYLMDPKGYVMMRYSAEHSGGEILKDLKKLLRYSRED